MTFGLATVYSFKKLPRINHALCESFNALHRFTEYLLFLGGGCLCKDRTLLVLIFFQTRFFYDFSRMDYSSLILILFQKVSSEYSDGY